MTSKGPFQHKPFYDSMILKKSVCYKIPLFKNLLWGGIESGWHDSRHQCSFCPTMQPELGRDPLSNYHEHCNYLLCFWRLQKTWTSEVLWITYCLFYSISVPPKESWQSAGYTFLSMNVLKGIVMSTVILTPAKSIILAKITHPPTHRLFKHSFYTVSSVS